jgi:hypothetical protein
MTRSLVKIPRHLRSRLRAVAARHQLGAADDAAAHFVTRGLDRFGTPPGALALRVAHAVSSQGYSSADELVEHLILRGLHAYEEPAADAGELAARLRGLGYIE